MNSGSEPVSTRHNVRVAGKGSRTLVFVHGYGCGQAMWRFLAPRYLDSHRVVLLDLAGNGRSSPGAYDPVRHASLDGHAQDLVEILSEVCTGGPAVVVGHSVGAMIGLLAQQRAPQLISAQAMLAPSPCFLNDGDYPGGFDAQELAALLDSLEENRASWARTVAPVIAGAGHAGFAEELAQSFCDAEPLAARQFARATFLSDYRAALPALDVPTLLVQCSEDALAPLGVGRYMRQAVPRSQLEVVDNVGHCPQVTAAQATGELLSAFLAQA